MFLSILSNIVTRLTNPKVAIGALLITALMAVGLFSGYFSLTADESEINEAGFEIAWEVEEALNGNTIYDIEFDEENGYIYISGLDEDVKKFDMNGNEVWSSELAPIGENTRGYTISYSQNHDILYVGTRDSLNRIDPETGDVVWYKDDEIDARDSDVDEETGDVFFGGRNNDVYRISTDGDEIWRDYNGKNIGSVVYNQETQDLFVGRSGSGFYYKYTWGGEVWSNQLENGDVNSLETQGDILYVGSDDGDLKAIDHTVSDSDEIEPIWTKTESRGIVDLTYNEDNGHLFYTVEYNDLKEIDDEQNEVWSFPIGDNRIWTDISYDNGFIMSETDNLVKLDEVDTENFEVQITDYTEEVYESSTNTVRSIDVDYEIENTGEIEGTQDVMFSVDQEEQDRIEDNTLATEETTTGSFSYTVTSSDIPEVEINVQTQDDFETRDIEVKEAESEFRMNITETNSGTDYTDEAEVFYEVENIGQDLGTQDVKFFWEGELEQTNEDLVLNEGETSEGNFTRDLYNNTVSYNPEEEKGYNDIRLETDHDSDEIEFVVTSEETDEEGDYDSSTDEETDDSDSTDEETDDSDDDTTSTSGNFIESQTGLVGALVFLGASILAGVAMFTFS